MRLTKLSIIMLVMSAVIYGQQAHFAGIAVNALNGEPLSGVHLKVFTLKLAAAGGFVWRAFR